MSGAEDSESIRAAERLSSSRIAGITYARRDGAARLAPPVLCLLVWISVDHLQEASMRNYLVLAGAVAGLFTLATPAQAQAARPAGISVTPYAGYMIFGDFLDGPVGTTLANANGPVLGAQLGIALSPNIAFIGNVARAMADLQLGLPLIGGIDVGESSAWLYDAGIQLGAPLGTRNLVPFIQVGAGAIQHSVNVGTLNTKATNFAFNAGVGADVAFSPNVGLRLMVKDYIGKFDFKEATTLNIDGKVAHNFALSAGVKLAF